MAYNWEYTLFSDKPIYWKEDVESRSSQSVFFSARSLANAAVPADWYQRSGAGSTAATPPVLEKAEVFTISAMSSKSTCWLQMASDGFSCDYGWKYFASGLLEISSISVCPGSLAHFLSLNSIWSPPTLQIHSIPHLHLTSTSSTMIPPFHQVNWPAFRISQATPQLSEFRCHLGTRGSPWHPKRLRTSIVSRSSPTKARDKMPCCCKTSWR